MWSRDREDKTPKFSLKGAGDGLGPGDAEGGQSKRPGHFSEMVGICRLRSDAEFVYGKKHARSMTAELLHLDK